MPPQTNKPSASVGVEIPIPITSGATDQPNAPQPSASPVSTNQDDLFPLLSKSPGFKEAMAKADQSGQTDEATTLPPAAIMMRNLRTLEGSELYTGATPKNRVLMQEAFYKKYVVPAQKAAQYKGSFNEWLKDRSTVWMYKVDPASQDKPLGGFLPGGITKKSSRESEKRSEEQGAAIAGGLAKKWLDTAIQVDNARIEAKSAFQNISVTKSLGAALLTGPRMIPILPAIMTSEYHAVREDETTKELHQFLKDDEYFALNGYQQTTTNKIMRRTGEFAGDLPLFFATDGIGAISSEMLGGAETLAQARKLLSMKAVQKIGARAIGNAAQGYIIGRAEGAESPTRTAEWFGGLSIAGNVAMRGLLSPAARYLGTIFGWGGGKLTGELANEAEKAVTSKAPQATVSPVSTALAGSPKQKISASVISSLNALTNGEFSKAPAAAKRAALAQLMVTSPEFAEQAAYLDKSIIASEAAQNLVAQRDTVPEFNNFMTKLEQASKEPTHISVANAAHESSEAQLMRRSSDKWVQEMFKDPTIRGSIEKDIAKYTGVERRAGGVRPGAASIGSLEFGDNLTKHIDAKLEASGLGKDTLQFETRADKMLFYLNVAQADLMKKGPSPATDREFQLLLSKLSEEFPGEKGSLANLIKMSDKVWADMEQATQAGKFREGETFRYWRQHSRPGESPFAHEVQLLQEAQRSESLRAEELKQEIEGKPPTTETEEQSLNRRMREAVAKSGGAKSGNTTTDTMIHRAVTERLFPGQMYEKLTPSEQSEVNQMAAEMYKRMQKGKK